MNSRTRSTLHIFSLLALLASLLGSMVFVTPVYAGGIVVNTATDEDTSNANCSLREAIIAANTNVAYNGCIAGSAGLDTITFAGNYTITLVGSQLPAVTSTIIINGNGEANTIIQANTTPNTATYRVFQVTAEGDLTLDDLTVQNGRCNGSCSIVGDSGGGIYNAGGAMTVSNVTFSANSATFLGGGMFNSSSSPTLTNVTFSTNSADYGGGGMYNSSSNPTLTNVTFSANSANYGGGGMYNSSSSPTLTNVTFSANSANYRGGGMYNLDSSSPTLMNVTFSANSASVGGGGMNNNTSSSPTLTNVTFTANSASDGGGISNYLSSPTLTNVTFSANSAYEGGGISNYLSSPTLTNVTFSDNSATSGGGMLNSDSSPTLTDVTFSANSAVTGGGVYNSYSYHDRDTTLTNVTFSDNTASIGGGMYITRSNLTLTNTLIANSASGGDCVNNESTLNAASSNNLIEDSANTCGLTNGVNGNIIGQDPDLDELTNNSGFTQTHALLAGSPAINTGTNTGCPAADQRGVTRPQNGTCDIGAYELDNTAPTVTMNSTSSNPTNTSPITVTVQFNETVTGFLAGDITPGNGTVSNFVAVNGDTYTFDLTPNGQGPVTADIAAGVVSDLAGNANTDATQFSRTYDLIAPTITMSSVASDPTNSSPIPITVQFSETVTGFLADDITPGNGTVGNFVAVDGDTYTFDLTPSGQGLVTADIAAGVVSDLAGNGNTLATQFQRTYITVYNLFLPLLLR